MATASAQPAGRPDLPPWQNAAGKAVLLFHLVLSPLLFCTYTPETFEGPKTALLTAAALTLAGLAASAWFSRGGAPRPTLPTDAATLGLTLFVASAALSTVFSISPLISWRGAPDSHAGLQTLLGYLTLYLATRGLCRTADDGRRLLAAVVVGAALSSVYAVIQAAHLDPVVWQDAPMFGGYARPFGLLGHANFLSAYLVMSAPLTTLLLLRGLHRNRWGAALTLALAAVLSGAAVVTALSRAAWLAAGAAALVLTSGWFLAGFRRAALIPFGLTILSVAVAFGVWAAAGLAVARPTESAVARPTESAVARPTESAVKKPVETPAEPFVRRLRQVSEGEGRWQIWRASWDLFRDRPLVGWGPDAFQLAFGRRRPADYANVEWDTTPTRAHNVALHILATQGLFGAAAAMLLAVGLVRAAVRAWGRSSPADRPLVAAVAASLTAFLVQDLFGFAVVSTGSLFVSCAALLSRWADLAPNAPPSPPRDSHTQSAGLLAGAGAAILVFFLNLDGAGGGAGVVLALTAAACVLAVRRLETPAASRALKAKSVVPPAQHLSWNALAVHVGIGLGTVAALYGFVIRPFQASLACGAGDRIVAAAPAEALTCYERAVSLDPDDDRTWIRLGGAAQVAAQLAPGLEAQRQLLEQARTALQRAIALAPAAPYNHANQGRLLGEMTADGLARGDEAIAEWDRTLALDPCNAPFLAEAARTALAVGRRDRTRMWAARGLELYPQYALLYAQQGACDFAEGRLEPAAVELDRALAADWHADEEDLTHALATLAAVQLARKQFEQACLLAGMACDRDPHWATPCLLRARALQAGGRRDEARREYRRLLTLDPANAEAHAALARPEAIP